MRVNESILIDESCLSESFVRGSGPGGQNVNKVASTVQLRFDAANCPGLTPAVRSRLFRLAGRRATQGGEIVIESGENRSQERNREAARERLAQLIRQAATPPKRRRKTRIPRSAKRKRLENKRQRSQIKSLRQDPS